MWECTRKLQNDGRVEHYALQREGTPLPYRDALMSWRDDETFRTFFVSLLTTANFKAYRWETPPITNLNAGRNFEFVLVDAPNLDQTPDPETFSEQFAQPESGQSVVTFANLGRDAVLVVPCSAGPSKVYGHLASFVRGASGEQVHALWHAVGTAMVSKLSDTPIWLSTAGMGVAWLHVRLDSRPKYYGFAPYRNT